MQRFFDILFSTIAIVVLSIFLAPLVVLLRFTGEGEILFRQDRVGRGQVNFKLLKFATMLKNSPNVGTGTVTVKSDPRVLPVGKFLRATKINELPQLLNILLGDMSLIGPRPLTRQTFSAYSHEVQNIVSIVRPGLSGVGSIIFRDEEGILNGEDGSLKFYREVIAPYKGSLECWYIKNQSIYLYFVLIILTILAVVNPSSSIAWRLFRGIPAPPSRLMKATNYYYYP